MSKEILPKPQLLLSGAYLIRALGLFGSRYECGECGATMFVRYESGLCPRCFNGQRAKHTESVVREVLLELEAFEAEGGTADAPAN
jgi:ribosomal protein S27AE